jgi:hypothetical protein
MTLYQTNYSIRKSIRCKFKKNRAHDVAQKMKKFTRNMNLRKTYKTRVHFVLKEDEKVDVYLSI